MKNLTLAIVSVLLIGLSSCKEKTIDQRITDTFKSFADTTFYEPITLDEVLSIEPYDSITGPMVWMLCDDINEAAKDIPQLIEECTALRQSPKIIKLMDSKDKKDKELQDAILMADRHVLALEELKVPTEHLETELKELTSDLQWINRLTIVIYQVFYKLHNQPVNEDYTPYYAVVNYSVSPPTITICEKCDNDFDQYTYLIGVINNLGTIYAEMIDVYYNYYNVMLEASGEAKVVIEGAE